MGSMDARRTCFVGGFVYAADEIDLDRAFSRFGPIEKIKVERDSDEFGKCYGFVTFCRRADMLRAVREMDGATLSQGVSPLFDTERFFLDMYKLIVREGVEVVDFIGECERCGHVGHPKTNCKSIDLADPRHELKGEIIWDEATGCRVYVMTEDDWPWNPPQGWSVRMYQEYKRCFRRPFSRMPIFPVDDGVDLRERMVRYFKWDEEFPGMVAARYLGRQRPFPKNPNADKWSEERRRSYEEINSLAARQEIVDTRLKPRAEEEWRRQEEEEREEKRRQEAVRIEEEKQRFRAQLASRSYADALRVGVSVVCLS